MKCTVCWLQSHLRNNGEFVFNGISLCGEHLLMTMKHGERLAEEAKRKIKVIAK